MYRMDTNTEHYTVNELMSVLEIPDNKELSLDELQVSTVQNIQQILHTDEEAPNSHNTLIEFIINAFEKICNQQNIQYNDEIIQTFRSLQHTSTLPSLQKSSTYVQGSHVVVNHTNQPVDDNYPIALKGGVINPLRKQTNSFLLNINTKFRENYFSTKSTDFIYKLPNPLKNVVSMQFIGAEIPNCVYTFSALHQTNEFTVQLFDNSGGDIINEVVKTIKIREGTYSGLQLENYLNKFVFNVDSSLNRIACDYHEPTCMFRFFYDSRETDKGGNGPNGDGTTTKFCFNLDFRIQENKTRPVQLNMGWLLGYKQPYYTWDVNYIEQEFVSYDKFEGYNPEGIYNQLGTNYFLLSVDDFNNNYAPNLVSPYQEGMMKNNGLLAKIANIPAIWDTAVLFEKKGVDTNESRNYFGPVNIDRIHIELLDDMGRIVDLNNSDFSFSLHIEVIYDL